MKPLCDIDRRCEFCAAPLVRKRSAKGKLEPPKFWVRRRFCGNACSRSSKRRDLWEWVHKTDGCWLWVGAKTDMGYGTYTPYEQPTVLAHRHIYQLLVGPIPDGLVLDHLCRTPLCVNPNRLEPVTQRENCLRGARSALRNAA